MDAASDVVTIPASAATATTIRKSTDTFNVNQSNNNSTHTQINAHTGSISLLSKTTSNVISNSLNIGGSSNSNSSCSSSSTSSNSSGYGTATTPTNNYDMQNTTPATTPIPSTPVANTEHIIPVATVAAVTPFYNEALTTHNLETQHHHHHHAQQPQTQHQLQQPQHHMLSGHHQQYSQNHLQPNIQHQQHHQYLPRQQYYSPYDYQQPAPTHNLSASSVTPAVTPYNMILPGPYEMATSTPSPVYGGSQYKASNPTLNSTYERNPLVKSNVVATNYTQQPQYPQVEPQQPKTINQHFTSILNSTKARSSSSLIGNMASTNSSKPQATATPFYANPTPFYDNFKHKIPLEYHDTYNSPSPATAATYHQQQKYYEAAKSQLKEASYGSPAVLGTKSAYTNTSNVFPGSTAGLNLSSASHDNYMYAHAPPTGFTATAHLGNETPPDVNNYRKPIMGSNMNSQSWPWGIDYASGNSRSIPPPTSNIPTATVAPTHATHLTQNPSLLARDSFYMTHDKYVGKYDKYSTSSYPQTYANSPTNRHMWPNTPNASNMTPLSDRHLLASVTPALPAHGLHTSSYYSNNPNASLNSRQTCCSQSYQPQSCYYPVSHPVPQRISHSQNPTVTPIPTSYLTAQQSLGQSPHLNALTGSCKYGGVLSDFGNMNKIKTSNDLYLNSHHYESNPPPRSFSYATAHNSQELYNSNAHQSVLHGATPTSLLANDSLNAIPTSYMNDLNLSTSNFDNYHTHLDNLSSQQTLTGIHNTQPPPAYGPTGAKRALLDYRKPLQPQPPPTIPEDRYTSLSSREHFNQHDLLNTPETTTTFDEYEVHQSNATDLTTEVLNDSEEATGESNKNLSLRDFIANWNDDEDEYQNNEEITFDQTAVINEVLQTAPAEEHIAAEVITIQEMKIIKPAIQNIKDVETPKVTVKTTAKDQKDTLCDTKANAYTNLPDIVIDIKKSNSVNNSTTTPTTPPKTPNTHAALTKDSLILSDFDVEKELDELNLRKPQQQELTKETNDFKDSKSVDSPDLSPCKLSFDDFNLEPTNKTVLSSITTALAATSQGSELNEPYSKDIEGYESSCSRHSNESAFEKEYETFINKITSETASSTKQGDQKSVEAEKDMDFDKNVQDFSKFYKRKRKLKEDEQKARTSANQNKKKKKTNEASKVNDSNFPQTYMKKCRMRLPTLKKGKLHKRKPLSVFYKIIYSLRHQELERKKRVREFLLDMKEKHLPLIKRQSIKNYTPDTNESFFNPKTLKAMCIIVFNTDEFRQGFLTTGGQEQPTSRVTETTEKHICDDPSCETCEIIKSFMDTEDFEATEMQQKAPPSTVFCTVVTKEPILILDDVTNIKDLNFRKEEAIIISNQIVNNHGISENISNLATKTVLSEYCVLDDRQDNFPIAEEQNMLVSNPAVIALQSAFDNLTDVNLGTSFSEVKKPSPVAPDFEFQTAEPSRFLTDTKLDMLLENPDESEEESTCFDVSFVENLKHSVDHTSFLENLKLETSLEKTSFYCGSSKRDPLDTIIITETFTEDNFQVQNPIVDITASNENLPAQRTNSVPLDDKNFFNIKNNEESDSEDSDLSESESGISSSDKSESRSSINESSGSETENDLDEDEVCSAHSKHSRHEKNQQSDSEDVSERNAEKLSCSAQRQNEISSGSPQRIILRITKSLSPNEQSLRVENISGKSLKTQNEHDHQIETDTESDEEKKFKVLLPHNKDLFAKPPSKKQTETLCAENCSKEKKLVTPLKLVLRGKEYLRVKTIKKSLKLQTERDDSNTKSELENKETFKKNVRENKEENNTKRSKLKDRGIQESNLDKFIPSLGTDELEQKFEKINKTQESEPNPRNLDTSIREDKIMNNEETKICGSKNNIQQGSIEDAEFINMTSSLKSCSNSESMVEEESTDLENMSSNKIPGNQLEQILSTANCNLQSSDNSPLLLNTDIIPDIFSQHSCNLSPKQFTFKRTSSPYDIMQDIESENASSFAIFPESRHNTVVGNIVKTSSLEVIETYSLTNSEGEENQRSEKDIEFLSDSESSNNSENDTYDDDDDESLEPITHLNNSKTIVISDDDTLNGSLGVENFDGKIQSSSQMFEDQQSCFHKERERFKTNRTDIKKNDSSCLQPSIKLKQDTISKVIESAKNKILALDSSFDLLKNDGSSDSELSEAKLAEILESDKKNNLNISDQDFSDFSPTSEEESDEETMNLKTNILKTQETDHLLLVPSFANSPRIENNKEIDAGSSDNSIGNMFPLEELSNKILNSEEVEGVKLIDFNQKTSNPAETGKDTYFTTEIVHLEASQSNESQNEREGSKKVNILERKISLEENLKEDIGEQRLASNEQVIQEHTSSLTPKALSPVPEKQHETSHTSSQESPKANPSVAIGEESELIQKRNLECEKSCVENNMKDVVREKNVTPEQPVLLDDNNSFSSRYCTPIFLQSIVDELPLGDIHLSTKTKAAYKSFDTQNVLQEGNISDSLSKKACSSSRNIVNEAHEFKKDGKTNEGHIISSTTISSPEDENLLEEDKSLGNKSEQSEMLDKVIDPDKFDNSELNDKSSSTCSSANKIPNELEESLESNITVMIKKQTSEVSEKTNTSNSTLATGNKSKFIDNIKNSGLNREDPSLLQKEALVKKENIAQTVPEVIAGNVDAQDLIKTMYEPSSMSKENCNISVTDKSLTNDDLHYMGEAVENLDNKSTTSQVKEQSQTYSEYEKSKNFENHKSAKPASLTLQKTSCCEVTNKDLSQEEATQLELIFCNTTNKPETTYKTHLIEGCRGIESLDEVKEIQESKISKTLENENKDHILEKTAANKLIDEAKKLEQKESEKIGANELHVAVRKLEQKESHFEELCEAWELLIHSKEAVSEEMQIVSRELSLVSKVKYVSEEFKTKISGEKTINSETKPTEESNLENTVSVNEKWGVAGIQDSKETNLKDNSIRSNELGHTSEVVQISQEANKDNKIAEVRKKKKCVSKPSKSAKEIDLKHSSVSASSLESICKVRRTTKEIREESIEEIKEESATTKSVAEYDESDLKEITVPTDNSGQTTAFENPPQDVYIEKGKKESIEELKDFKLAKPAIEDEVKTVDESTISCNKLALLLEGHPRLQNDNTALSDEKIILEEELFPTAMKPDTETKSKQTNELNLVAEVKHTSKQINRKDKDLSKPIGRAKQTEEKSLKESSTPFKDLDLPPEVKKLSINITKEESDEENMGAEQEISRALEMDRKNGHHDLQENLILKNKLDLTFEINPISKDGEQHELHSIKEKEQNKSISKECKTQYLENQIQFFGVSYQKADKENNEKPKRPTVNVCETSNQINDQNSGAEANNLKSLDQTEESVSAENDKLATEEYKPAKPSTQKLEMSDETSSVKNTSKPCITPDEISTDFFGLKNHCSFEDESEDFHGFEDLEEVTRIRQEIENINDDSVANDGFLNNSTLNQDMVRISAISLTDSTIVEINELEALEKELSHHEPEIQVAAQDKETEKECSIKTFNDVSTNDIENIKQMLESDEEPQNDNENKLEILTTTSEDKSAENKYNNISNDCLSFVISKIPKLSDLCRAALNSSLNSSSNLAQQHTETTTIVVERELSVEEALAEMYRQAGVLLSDPEDCDNDEPSLGDTEAQDVLLINLHEILNSDNNDVYVLQCDMNENVLNVVQSSEDHEAESLENVSINTERVNTVQIILDTQNSERQIHIISSDSESEVIILSDDESEINYKPFRAREKSITIPFITDEEINNGEDSLFDISTIHHEEIVPDNLDKFLREEFYKYLHEKYVQRNISKYYHANRVLKKYKRFIRRQ